MKSKLFLTGMICLVAAAAFAGAADMTRMLPDAFLPQDDFAFGEVLEGAEVVHEFRLQNRGDAPLHVTGVRTG